MCNYQLYGSCLQGLCQELLPGFYYVFARICRGRSGFKDGVSFRLVIFLLPSDSRWRLTNGPWIGPSAFSMRLGRCSYGLGSSTAALFGMRQRHTGYSTTGASSNVIRCTALLAQRKTVYSATRMSETVSTSHSSRLVMLFSFRPFTIKPHDRPKQNRFDKKSPSSDHRVGFRHFQLV